MAEKPGKGFLGWLGRQVGHVKQAVKTDVSKPPAAPEPAAPETVIYRNGAVEEAVHPEDQKLKLRRTTIDEVIKRQDDQA